MSLHSIEVYQEEHQLNESVSLGDWRWRVKVGDNIVADSAEGYRNKKDCLHSLFGLWFGTWDESFLGLYNEWQSYAGETYDVPPEAQDGPPVHIAHPLPDADAPNYEASATSPERPQGEHETTAGTHADENTDETSDQ